MTQNRRPTFRQKRAVEELVDTFKTKGDKSLKGIMTRAGYSKYTAKQPHKNFLSKPAVQKLLEDKGISREWLIDLLKEDLKEKKGNRVKELDMAFKLHNAFPATKHELDVSSEQIDSILDTFKNIMEGEDEKPK